MRPERLEPLVLVKFFKEERFADAFIRGELFAPRLPYFRGIDEEGHLRGDPYEATELIYPASMTVSTVDLNPRTGKPLMSMDIPKESIAGPLMMRQPAFDRYHLFCMSEIFLTIKEAEEIAAGKPSPVFRFDERLSKFGRHVVVVFGRTFLDRVRKACNSRGFIVYPGAVDYYDPRNGRGAGPMEFGLVFQKRLEYAYQSEFRLAIDTGLYGENPLTLNIGNIDDIAVRLETDNINKEFGFKVDISPSV